MNMFKQIFDKAIERCLKATKITEKNYQCSIKPQNDKTNGSNVRGEEIRTIKNAANIWKDVKACEKNIEHNGCFQRKLIPKEDMRSSTGNESVNITEKYSNNYKANNLFKGNHPRILLQKEKKIEGPQKVFNTIEGIKSEEAGDEINLTGISLTQENGFWRKSFLKILDEKVTDIPTGMAEWDPKTEMYMEGAIKVRVATVQVFMTEGNTEIGMDFNPWDMGEDVYEEDEEERSYSSHQDN